MIQIQCPCGKLYGAGPDLAGKTLECPACKRPLHIPQHSEIGAAPAAAPDPFSAPISAPVSGMRPPAADPGPFPPSSTPAPNPEFDAPHPFSPYSGLSIPSPERGKHTSWIIGLSVGVVVSLILGLALGTDSPVGRMFSPTRVESLIPTTILVLFIWGLCACIFRRQYLSALAPLCAPARLHEITIQLRAAGPSAALIAVSGPQAAASPLLRRIRSVLEQWQVSPGLQDADVLLQQHGAHDEETSQSAYNLPRLLVWALPVLGLIGTVIGISFAVGGFATFLGGSSDDVGEIKRNLVSVTSGLSFAFLITLAGLATSLTLMFMVSALTSRETRILTAVQQMIADGFLPALQSVAPAVPAGRSAADDAGARQLRESLDAAAKSMLLAMQETSGKLLSATENRLQSATNTLAETLTSQSRTLSDNAAVLRQIAEASQAATRSLQAMSDAARTVTSDGFQDRMASLAETMRLATSHGSDMIAANHRLTEATSQLGAVHQAVQHSLMNVVESKLPETLASVRESLHATVSALGEFRKPFVLRAVPVDGHAQ